MNFKIKNTSIIFSGIVQALKSLVHAESFQYLYWFWKFGHEVSLEIYKYINVSIIENLAIIYFTRITEFR